MLFLSGLGLGGNVADHVEEQILKDQNLYFHFVHLCFVPTGT